MSKYISALHRKATALVGAGVGATLLFPALAFAEEVDSLTGIFAFIQAIQGILNVLLPLVVTLAILAFFWGLVMYLWAAGDPKQRAQGKGLMIWGVIALFVMVSIWGLVQVIGSLFGIDNSQFDASTINFVDGLWREGGGAASGGATTLPPPVMPP